MEALTMHRCFMDDPRNYIGIHRTLPLIPNGFPIGALHCLLVTPEHREQLLISDLESAVTFARDLPNYVVFHNMRGAGATQPQHAHLQAVLRDERLPIEAAGRQELVRVGDAVVISRIVDYPAYGLALRGEKSAQVTFAILGEVPGPFNLVFNREELIIVPRGKEQPSGFESLFGGLEMCGNVVVTNDERFGSLSHDEVIEAISECGWSPERGRAFEKQLGTVITGALKM